MPASCCSLHCESWLVLTRCNKNLNLDAICSSSSKIILAASTSITGNKSLLPNFVFSSFKWLLNPPFAAADTWGIKRFTIWSPYWNAFLLKSSVI